MELNIGHFLIGEAIFSGLDSAIRRMRALMDQARTEAFGEGAASVEKMWPVLTPNVGRRRRPVPRRSARD